MASKFIRGFAGALIGSVTGAAAGALTFGWDQSLAIESTWIGPGRNFWPLAAEAGAFLGALFGLALGLFITLLKLRVHIGLVVGYAVGISGALFMVFDGLARFSGYAIHV